MPKIKRKPTTKKRYQPYNQPKSQTQLLSPLSTSLIEKSLLSVDQDVSNRGIERLRKESKLANGIGVKHTAYLNAIKADPTFQEFEKKYNLLQNPKLSSTNRKTKEIIQQLGNLTAKSLADLPVAANNQQGLGGTLDSINLLSKPATIGRPPIPADFYESDHPVGKKGKTEQRLTFSPTTGALNPVQAFTHEGIHAIHDLYKAPHQQEMINFLAQEESRARLSNKRKKSLQNYDSWLKPLLKGAQELINEPGFIKDYDYENTLKPDIKKSFTNLNKAKSFADAKKEVANDRFHSPPEPSGDAFLKSLSEFPAFMSERLNTPFVVQRDAQGVPMNDPARRFTKENLRTMYRDYNELSGGNLATEYPLVHQAFFDRYNELRNPIRVISPDPTRQAASLLKMGAAPVPLGSPLGTLPILAQNAPPVQKPALNPYTVPLGGGAPVPNPFPTPKYTNRAHGGHIKTNNLKCGLSNFLKKLNNDKRINFVNAYQCN